MTLYRVQHAFLGTGGTSKDQYVNNFHIWHQTQVLDSGANLAFSQGVAVMIRAFYNSAGNVQGLTIREYLSQRCAGYDTVKIYNAAVPFSGAPVYQDEEPFGGSVPNQQSLPEEVALCLSYRATATGVPRARRSGRIYLGPFSVAAMDDVNDASDPVRPNPGLQTAMITAAGGLQASLNSGGYSWRVYSPTMNNSWDIDQWFIDDAFDTIRNRGTAPSSRVEN